jgi:hypothetical protein
MSTDDDFPDHLANLRYNVADVGRLLEIHEKLAGKSRGRKRDVEVLNKSGVVLLVACWESFVEDLAVAAFDYLLAEATQPDQVPRKVLAMAAKRFREDPDETLVWQLAGPGWKTVLAQHRNAVVAKFTRPFNTPRADNVDELFEAMIGLRTVSRGWSWKGTTREKVCSKLSKLIELRGEIAHRVKAGRSVHKKTVVRHSHFVNRLAGVFSNQVAEYLEKTMRAPSWGRYEYMGGRRSAG